jgi:hypothetical protein
MAPLTGRELASGFFWGKMSGWIIWLVFVLAMSGLLTLLGAASRAMAGEGEVWWTLSVWASLAFYCVTQSLWAGAVTFFFATTHRSVLTVQLLSLLILAVAAPAVIGAFKAALLFLVAFLSSHLGESSEHLFLLLMGRGAMGGFFLAGGLLGGLFQTVKLLLAIWLLSQASGKFSLRMQTMHEQSDIVGK